MASIWNSNERSASYAAYRPTIPDRFFEVIDQYYSEKASTDNIVEIGDIGCGPGIVTIKIAEHYPTARVHGIDFGATQIEQAQALYGKHSNIDFKVHDCNVDLPFSDNSLDLIIGTSAAHWLDQHVFMKEVKRVLKPDGLLVVASYDPLINMVRIENEPPNNVVDEQMANVIAELTQGLMPFMCPRNQIVCNQYKALQMPFKDCKDYLDENRLPLFVRTNIERLKCGLNTMGFVMIYKQATNGPLIDDFIQKVEEIIKKYPGKQGLSAEQVRNVPLLDYRPYVMRMSRK